MFYLLLDRNFQSRQDFHFRILIHRSIHLTTSFATEILSSGSPARDPEAWCAPSGWQATSKVRLQNSGFLSSF
jgi:hypothetical protein